MMRRLLTVALIWATVQSAQALPPGQYDFTDDGINYAFCAKTADGTDRRMADTVMVRQGSVIPSDGEVIIPEVVEFDGRSYVVGQIDSYAFEGRRELKSIILPASLTVIANSAFADCRNLSKVEMPEGLKEIELWAFRNCSGLSDAELPHSVRAVGNTAFDGAGMKNFKCYGGLESLVGWNLFGFGHSLDYIRLPESISKVTDLSAKVVDYYGNNLKISYVMENSNWKTLLLHTTAPFCPWPENTEDYIMDELLKFAKKCTVYVPDEAVAAFRSSSHWKQFKAVKPLSEYKK